MMVGMEEDARMAAAAVPGSECSSGCQSGWTTYLDDDRSSYSYTYDTARLHGLPQQPCYGYGCDYSEEEDDLSMVSDASSGPRQQHSAGSDEGAAALANARAARRVSRMVVEPAGTRRQSKMSAAAAVASTLLEDTASSPAFFKHTKVMSSPEGSGYGGAAGSMMEMGSAADFSCAFLATTGYEFESPLNASSHLGGYLQVQYPPAAVKPMPTRQVCRDGSETIQRW